MSFRNIPLLRYYKTYKNNVVREFYTPVLKEAVLYQRAVGFLIKDGFSLRRTRAEHVL